MLALRRGRMVDVDALVDRLWGEELPAAPRNALHHHIARLRAALGDESIVGSSDGYALKSARLDAAEFEEAIQLRRQDGEGKQGEGYKAALRRVESDEGKKLMDQIRKLAGERMATEERKLLAETRIALREGDVGAAADAVASALALWRGPALQGLTGTRWFSAEARRLETLQVDALEAVRGRARARRAPGAHAGHPSGGRGQPLPRTPVGAADGGALPQALAACARGDVAE